MDLEENVSWSEIESLVQILATKISNSSRKYSSIVTLSRGGLVPSRLLADHLDIRKILVDEDSISSDSLFVDDIFDTGNTFAKILPRVDDPSRLTLPRYLQDAERCFPNNLSMQKKNCQ